LGLNGTSCGTQGDYSNPIFQGGGTTCANVTCPAPIVADPFTTPPVQQVVFVNTINGVQIATLVFAILACLLIAFALVLRNRYLVITNARRRRAARRARMRARVK
jgi:hypothetical protein